MRLKTLTLIAIFTLLIGGCEVSIDDSSGSKVSSNSTVLKTKEEVYEFILDSIKNASALDLSVKVKTYLTASRVDVTFYYVCNNSDVLSSYEMALTTFIKVVDKDNKENELLVSQSYYQEGKLYFSLLNVSNGLYDKYLIQFEDDISVEELKATIGENLFYSTPQDDIFTNIDEELLNKASLTHNNVYIINLTNVNNSANITYIKVDNELTQYTILTDELDDDNNKLEQEIKVIPKFNNEKILINFPSDITSYVNITLEELHEIMN